MADKSDFKVPPSLTIRPTAAPRVRRWTSYSSLTLTAVIAAVCGYYLLEGLGYSRAAASLQATSSLAWTYRSESAAAYLQLSAWVRALIFLGAASVSTYPFAALGGRTLLERCGMVSRDWKKALATWAFVGSALLLAAVAFLNYDANVARWATRWDLDQAMQLLGLVQLNTIIYEPFGVISGVGEIAKWFAILLVMTTVSFFLLSLSGGLRKALVGSTLVLLLSLFLYEFGLIILCPAYDYVWVTAMQVGTPVQWFTNADLLCVSASGAACLTFLKSANRLSRIRT